MTTLPGPQVFDLASRIPGLAGVELQVHFHGQALWDKAVRDEYRTAAKRSGLEIPSVAGIWPASASILHQETAEDHLRKAIEVAEALGARVILAATLGDKCPRMDDESSYGPVVSVLQKVSPAAASAGVTIGLETSLRPEDDSRLVDLVDRPSVRSYYDAYNTETKYPGQAVGGYEVIGKQRLCQCHFKNGNKLLEEAGPVDWAAAVRAVRRIGYAGWYVFETAHSDEAQCITATVRNIAFVQRYARADTANLTQREFDSSRRRQRGI